jgi:hypothetical protein
MIMKEKARLIKAASELNGILGIEPKIPTKSILKKDLIQKIMDASCLIDINHDQISDETIELLKQMHRWPPDLSLYPESGWMV